MKVINEKNEILNSSVSIEKNDGVYGLVLESRGGAKDSKFARNTDYFEALEIILERLKRNKTVGFVNIYLASRSSLLKPINERIVNIDGSNSINVGNYDAKDLRIKISSAISKMKDNEASKGGNPTKRILLSTNLNQDEWEKIVKNNSEYSVPDDDKLPEESAFNPNDIEDGIEKIIRAITLRRGQSKFRQKLIKAYNGKCAITQSMVLPTLQAAHIYPYKGDETNHITNGILLRSDVHDLFDLHLIGINEDYEIIISEELIGSEYEVYNGKEILLPKEHSEFPSKLSLKLRPIPKRIL